MLDPKFIEKNLDLVREKILQRGVDFDFEKLISIDERRRRTISETQKLEHQRNQGSKKFGELKRNGKDNEASELQSELRSITEKIKIQNGRVNELEFELREILLEIPNLSDESVPIGSGEKDNVEIRKWGTPTEFNFEHKDHVEIGTLLGILDLGRASKISGSRFSLYKGLGARLERALINFMLDIHVNEHMYQEVLPPFVALRDCFIGTGNLPKFEDDLFKVEDSDLYLIPTAEVPVTNIHRDEIVNEKDLPIKYVACTPCFRREAGSYGKDVYGIMRQHQFNKVELVKFSKPEQSYNELELLTNDAAWILELLKIPYRVISLCTGDIGFSSAKTYDIEVWVPSENKYREISSCSNFEDFQARRASIRYKNTKTNKTELVHTLNGSGLAVGRTVIAILENYQQEDGSVLIPEIIRDYMGGLEKITAK